MGALQLHTRELVRLGVGCRGVAIMHLAAVSCMLQLGGQPCFSQGCEVPGDVGLAMAAAWQLPRHRLPAPHTHASWLVTRTLRMHSVCSLLI